MSKTATAPTPIPRNRARPQPARQLDLEAPEGTILVKRVAYAKEHDIEETVRVPAFHTTPGRVRVCGSVTKNLGNYNSARVEVMVELPCYPEDGEIERAYNHAATLVDKYIQQELTVALQNDGS